jgi:catechol 2,3-dioxygenase-like lactoylglutathione lyase family enzyme
MSQAARKGGVVGIGGIFFKSSDHTDLRQWYAEHLGIDHGSDGAMFKWLPVPDAATAADSTAAPELATPGEEHLTIWSIFPAASKYFDPSSAPFMINYIVEDLDALLARLASEGVRIDPKREDFDYGRFAWIYDPDGNKIELWQPSSPNSRSARRSHRSNDLDESPGVVEAVRRRTDRPQPRQDGLLAQDLLRLHHR